MTHRVDHLLTCQHGLIACSRGQIILVPDVFGQHLYPAARKSKLPALELQKYRLLGKVRRDAQRKPLLFLGCWEGDVMLCQPLDNTTC